jgi:hypothetical protein
MKKEYINPTICVVTLNTVGMLAASLPQSQETVTNEDKVLAIEFFDDVEEEEW